MKKVLSVLVAVLVISALLVACGGKAPKGELKGKTAPVVAAGSSASHRVVTFSFALDAKGYKAVMAIIKKEIKNAEKGKKKEQAKNLKDILGAFKSDPVKTIKGVSVAGPFNGWKAGKDKLAASKSGKYTVFTLKKEWEFSGEKEMYKLVFSLNAGDDVLKQAYVWVPDPMAAELKPDGFGGQNSLLLIPGFKVSDKKDKKAK